MLDSEFKVPTYWNKNLWGDWWQRKINFNNPSVNDLLNPANSLKLCEFAKRTLNADFLYGGWMEERDIIWKDSYLKEKGEFLHLGIDVWVPANTHVYLDRPGTIVEVEDDRHSFGKGGWGTRVMVQLRDQPVVLLYGHLAPAEYKEGTDLRAHYLLGHVGNPEENGGWAPHIHVQAMSTETYEYFRKHPKELDGYGHVKDIEKLAAMFPDPIRYINLI